MLIKPCLPERLAASIADALRRGFELRKRGDRLQQQIDKQLRHASDLLDRSRAIRGSRSLTRRHSRGETPHAPHQPVDAVCPMCNHPLRYIKSFISGVSVKHSEQWDYFECATGCGTFQYRQRTRKLRRVS